jgi:ferric-dicitrate binding protein FerR (iron transport regulator)
MINTKLIYKVLSGEASESEKTALEKWRTEHPANAEDYEDIKLLYQADQDFDARVNERDEQFYDGLRNIQLQIKKIKRKHRILGLAKTFGMAVLITAVIFSISLITIQLAHQSRISRSKERDIATLLLNDNLVFKDTTLRNIMHMLESQYPLTIHTRNRGLLSCKFTGTFYRGISIEDMLRMLALAEGFDVTTNEPGIVELDGEGCQL